VVVSNHASNLDSLLLTLAFAGALTFTAKRQVFSLPLLGRVLRRLGHLPVERVETRGRLAAYVAAREALAAGRRVHFFPESTFTPATGVRPFRLGAFRLAVEQGVPVVPVALVGTRRALRDGRLLLRPARLEVRVLEPLPPPGADDGFRALLDLREEARRRLAEAAGEPLLDIASAALPPGTPGASPVLSPVIAEEAP
jgi:1-acyl-sn-glycerol-3-phosphate acyltransferase